MKSEDILKNLLYNKRYEDHVYLIQMLKFEKYKEKQMLNDFKQK